MNSRMDSIVSKASDDLMLIFDRSAISCIIFTRALQIGGILSDNDIEMLSHSRKRLTTTLGLDIDSSTVCTGNASNESC